MSQKCRTVCHIFKKVSIITLNEFAKRAIFFKCIVECLFSFLCKFFPIFFIWFIFTKIIFQIVAHLNLFVDFLIAFGLKNIISDAASVMLHNHSRGQSTAVLCLRTSGTLPVTYVFFGCTTSIAKIEFRIFINELSD